MSLKVVSGTSYKIVFLYSINSFLEKVYVAGGNNGQIALNTFEEYDVFTNERHRLQNMIIPRDELSLVACNGGIFAIGGGSYNGAVLKSVERYDFNNGIWEKIPDMIIPRRAHSLCCVNNKIYAFGGFDGEKYLSSVETYDEKASRWVQIKFMSSSRCTHVSVKSPDNNSIIIIGGYNGKSLNIVERFRFFWLIKLGMISRIMNGVL